MKNLIIAAHPDDEVLGCGGLIKKLAKKRIGSYVLILTGGAETRYSKNMEAVLRNNAIKANRILGTKEVFFENLPNQQLDTIPILRVIQLIEGYIHRLKPDTVFTHHIGDLNRDHRIAYEATSVATRPIAGQIVKKVYSYNVPSSTEWVFNDGSKNFVPNVFIDIADEIHAKIEAMKCYPSECRVYPHPRSPQAIRVYSNYWGIRAGFEYAEPFKLTRNSSGEI